MTGKRVYLILQEALCALLVALLCASAVGIFREGSARRAEDPMARIYTPEIVAERFAPIAPLCFVFVGLTVAGLLLGARDENADRPVKDAASARDLVVARVARPSEAMQKERAAQRRLAIIGWGAFALCMVPVAVYIVNPAHFPERDLEGMFYALLRVLLPWTAAGLGALVVTAVLREKCVLRETEAAQAQLSAERASGVMPAPKPAAQPEKRGAAQIALIVAAVALIVIGIVNGSARDVLYKAIMICTECVGLG